MLCVFYCITIFDIVKHLQLTVKVYTAILSKSKKVHLSQIPEKQSGADTFHPPPPHIPSTPHPACRPEGQLLEMQKK